MRKTCVFAAFAVLCAAPAVFAQNTGSQSASTQGFTITSMIMELSLFLPPGENGRMGGPGGQAGPGGQPQGQQSGTQPSGAPQAAAPQAGGGQPSGQQAGAQSTGRQGGGSGGRFLTIQRDPKLYFTADQADKLIALLQPLRDNPFPTPSGAKNLQALIDSILTTAQKAERDTFRAERDKAVAQAQSQGAGAQGRGGQFFANLQNMTPDQRQQFISNLPPDQQQRIKQYLAQAAQEQQLTPLQQRQRQLDAFLQALKDWKNQPKA